MTAAVAYRTEGDIGKRPAMPRVWNARKPKHAAQVMANGGANDFPRLNALLHCFAVKVAESFVAPVSTTGIVRTVKE